MQAKATKSVRASAQSRRGFIQIVSNVVAVAATMPALATAKTSTPARRVLTFHHLHTGEKLSACYWRDNAYDSEALASVDKVLRDFRTGEVFPIARRLLDNLTTIQSELGVTEPFLVIGGYRSPKTNEMLRNRSTGVAKRSLHMDGRAVDVRIAGVDSNMLREAAADLRLGGVGYYRKSNFVHLDTGRPRVW